LIIVSRPAAAFIKVAVFAPDGYGEALQFALFVQNALPVPFQNPSAASEAVAHKNMHAVINALILITVFFILTFFR
jgi:hypothetical protein